MYKAMKTRLNLPLEQRRFLRFLMRESRSLYNQALYNVRQHFFNTGAYLSYQENYHLLKDSEHFRVLNSSQAQMVLRKVDEAMKAFFGSLRAKSKQKVRLPHYLKKDAYYPLFDRMVYKPNKEVYTLPRSNFVKRLSHELESISEKLRKHTMELDEIDSLSLDIQTPKRLQQRPIQEITIRPLSDGRRMEIVYVYQEEAKTILREERTETMGIDLGYDNLAFCAVTNNEHLLIDGRRLKSMNQHHHKQIARLASLRSNQKVLTKQMLRLIDKRNHQMEYGIFKAARLILDHALHNNVGLIVIEYNDTFKDERFRDTYNQWTKSIPLARLRDRIVYLAEQVGIETKIVNEAYTSKASYLDGDPLTKTEFSGKRIKRGLYQTKSGRLINADQNAALNMIHKGNPNAVRIGTTGANTPKRTCLFGV
jgi:IS605 OrfB family transposase